MIDYATLLGLAFGFWLHIGMFAAGLLAVGSVVDGVIVVVIWPFIPAYLMGLKIRTWWETSGE